MKIKELRKLLTETKDKLAVFSNKDILDQYDIYVSDAFELMSEFLDDDEIMHAFEIDYIKESASSENKYKLFNRIKNGTKKLEILLNPNIISQFVPYEILKLAEFLGENEKIQLLEHIEYLRDKGMQNPDIAELIVLLSDENKKQIVLDKALEREPFNLRRI